MLLNHLLTVCLLRKLYISLLCLVLNFSKSVTVLFRSIPNGNCLFSSASLLREITHWCMDSDGSCWAACKCNLLCPTSSFKLVYPKSQSVIGSNLKVIFLLWDSVWTSTGSSRQVSTTSDSNCSWVIPHQMVQHFWGLDFSHLRIW